jgi:hypothetical protein
LFEVGSLPDLLAAHGLSMANSQILAQTDRPGSSAERRRRTGGPGGSRFQRSDIALKHDITLLGHLDNGLGFYRFSYNGSDKAYVGVMAQEVHTVMPKAVVRDRDGYLRVFYEKLGVRFQTYEHWIALGARVPAAVPVSH